MMEAKQSGRLAETQPIRRKRPATAKNHYRMAEMIEKIAIMSDLAPMTSDFHSQPTMPPPSHALPIQIPPKPDLF
jgi:hypothetical protein